MAERQTRIDCQTEREMETATANLPVKMLRGLLLRGGADRHQHTHLYRACNCQVIEFLLDRVGILKRA